MQVVARSFFQRFPGGGRSADSPKGGLAGTGIRGGVRCGWLRPRVDRRAQRKNRVFNGEKSVPREPSDMREPPDMPPGRSPAAVPPRPRGLKVPRLDSRPGARTGRRATCRRGDASPAGPGGGGTEAMRPPAAPAPRPLRPRCSGCFQGFGAVPRARSTAGRRIAARRALPRSLGWSRSSSRHSQAGLPCGSRNAGDTST